MSLEIKHKSQFVSIMPAQPGLPQGRLDRIMPRLSHAQIKLIPLSTFASGSINTPSAPRFWL